MAIQGVMQVENRNRFLKQAVLKCSFPWQKKYRQEHAYCKMNHCTQYDRFNLYSRIPLKIRFKKQKSMKGYFSEFYY